MAPRERVIVTGGRAFGHALSAQRARAPEQRRQAAEERAYVEATLTQQLLIADYGDERGVEVLVGDCPTGVDAITRAWCKAKGVRCHVFEADWRVGRRAGPERNGRMVAAGADRCLAFPGGDGTADCARRAERAGIPVWRAIP